MSVTTAAPAPLIQRLSVDEFLVRYADDPHVELVDGVVKEQPVSSPMHGYLCGRMMILLGVFVETHDLGRVMCNDTRVRVNPESVRGGDVIYYSYERLPRGKVPDKLHPAAPDLVAEVKSPSNDWIDLFEKVLQYLRSGVRVVILLDHETATVSVYRLKELQQIFDNGDTLTLPDVLPGFSVPVARIFT